MPVSTCPTDPIDLDAPETAWLAWSQAGGVTARTKRDLLSRCHTPAELRELLQAALRGVPGSLPGTLRETLSAATRCDGFAQALAWQAADPNHRLIGLDHPLYPASLLATDDPPVLLYLNGQAASLAGPQVAIVGSRKATAPGCEQARRLAAELSRAGISVISGLAWGIDAAAHRGALAAGGPTVAVLATAPDRVYPAAHRQLAQDIACQGLQLSEFGPGSVLRPGCFPRRNRLISGLSLGVVVIEATLRSGSLITARHAAEQGREVMAMPGSVTNPQARGCHELLRQGATLVESAVDVLSALQPALQRVLDDPSASAAQPVAHVAEEVVPGFAAENALAAPADAHFDSPDARAVWEALGHDALPIDTLVQRCHLPAERVAQAVATLELAARVSVAAGGRYRRN